MRYRPYTALGLSRKPCAHCGAPASEQWNIKPCATGRKSWHALCLPCDIEMNRLALAFVNHPKADALVLAYEARKKAA